ncbi:MAG TPA: hypothetical protein VGX28_05345 [Frankiaceae bacterium]|jgi:hypothetical protein|nr:hypothetical protein [Frankiaceae bacterium]
MRRLLAALVLVAAMPVAPGSAAPPAAPLAAPAKAGAIAAGTIGPGFVPGRRLLVAPTEAERVHREYESLAVTKESAALVRRYAEPLARAAEGYDARLAGATATPDLDGDGVDDVLLYDMTIWRRPTTLDGDTTLAAFSGRNGRQLWRRTFEDVSLPGLYWERVGDRRSGIVVVDPVGATEADYGYRFVGVGGSRGDVVYDTTVANGDGRGGTVRFGGFFDAFSGGGTDVLLARVETVVGFGVAVDGIMPPSVDFWQAYVLDGRDGKVRAVSQREIGIGGYPAFVPTGDLDGDKRDDYAIFRRGVTERGGTVDTRSVVENKKLWENTAVPLGWYVGLPEQGDIVADRHTDLFYVTDLTGASLTVRPVTDELTPFQGAVPGGHGVLLDGLDGVLRRDLADGGNTAYATWADVDRDGKRDVVSATWESGLREYAVTLALLTKAGTVVRWRRAVVVPVDFPGAASGYGWLYPGGDVDADGVADLAYDVAVGTLEVTKRRAQGFVLGRTGEVLQTRDLPLEDTLDGRGDDRFGVVEGKDREGRARVSYAMRDGRRATTYWSFTVREPSLFTYLMPIGGQRGRCAGVLLVAIPTARERAGEVWAAALDGGTGRVRWARTLNLRLVAPYVSAPAGPPVRCR